LTKPKNRKKTKKRICENPKGSEAVGVKAAGHFFHRVGCRVGKKMNAPEGLGLDTHYVRGLVGNCLFLYRLFFVYKNIYTF